MPWSVPTFGITRPCCEVRSSGACIILNSLLTTICIDDNLPFCCRGWAKETVQHFGKIQLSGDYGNDQYLLDVLDEWMYILESEEFNKSVLSLDLKSTKDLQDVSALLDISLTASWYLSVSNLVLTSYFDET